MIELHGVSKTYTLGKGVEVHAVQDVDLTVDRGEFAIITGRSGSGKTTLLNLVAGLATPTAGRVILDGSEIWRLPDSAQSLWRSKTIGFVFQFPSLLPSLTALENVMLPTMFVDDSGRADAASRATELLDSVGLADKLGSYPRQLSAGQQQRVVIARSLVNDPQLLLADEPTSDLDEQTEHEIMTIFQDIHTRTGITILLVTHATNLVRFGTRAVRMSGGQIVA
ncbi:MAG: ABC transporter ATP-binding protein [Chloroflexi bacterium]|nr:ABC transporter ATP-binding protein [Chloroflexota bacterium]